MKVLAPLRTQLTFTSEDQHHMGKVLTQAVRLSREEEEDS